MTKKELMVELAKLNIVLTARKSAQELEVIAGIWYEDFGHISIDDFRIMLKRQRRVSPYWPSPSELFEQKNLLISENRPLQIQMEDPKLTPEEIQDNKDFLKRLNKRLAKIGRY
jgi:hypothetical protein